MFPGKDGSCGKISIAILCPEKGERKDGECVGGITSWIGKNIFPVAGTGKENSELPNPVIAWLI